jgi:UDP-N-acetylmuramyl pentapeptide phosphotransferase/UDP-N-acetylglucosamine-1-phosphate transferase
VHGIEQSELVLGVAGASALLFSLLAGFVVHRWLARWQVIDRPNERSSHATPTLRGGGIGIMAVILFGAVWLSWHCASWQTGLLALTSGLLSIISFCDDRKPLPWRVRLGTHFGAAAVMLCALLHAELLAAPVWVGPSGLLVLLWFAGYANVFNFMDGINGLAAGQAVVTGIGTAMVGISAGLVAGHPAILLAVVLAGAAGGFLPHNFPRARMFMGDVSSIPLGFMLAVLAIWVAHDAGWWLLVPLGLLHTNFWLDSGITIIRRKLRGEVLYQAHREHFYQRLVRAGWSHPSVTGWEMGLQILVLGLVVVGVGRGPWALAWTVPVVFGVWLAFFAVCEWTFARARGHRNEPDG